MYKYLYIFIYINLYFALSCPKIPHLKRLMTSRSNFRNYCKSKSKDKVSLMLSYNFATGTCPCVDP